MSSILLCKKKCEQIWLVLPLKSAWKYMAMLLRWLICEWEFRVSGLWFGGSTEFPGICLARPDLEREKDVCFAFHHSPVLFSLCLVLRNINNKLRISMSVRLSGINSGLLGTFVFLSLVKGTIRVVASLSKN